MGKILNQLSTDTTEQKVLNLVFKTENQSQKRKKEYGDGG